MDDGPVGRGSCVTRASAWPSEHDGLRTDATPQRRRPWKMMTMAITAEPDDGKTRLWHNGQRMTTEGKGEQGSGGGEEGGACRGRR